MIIFYVVALTYIAAVNFYSVLAIKRQKYETDSRTSDKSILLAAALGGAAGIFIAMLIMRYRLDNLKFMVLIPVLAAIDAGVLFLVFRRVPVILSAL